MQHKEAAKIQQEFCNPFLLVDLTHAEKEEIVNGAQNAQKFAHFVQLQIFFLSNFSSPKSECGNLNKRTMLCNPGLRRAGIEASIDAIRQQTIAWESRDARVKIQRRQVRDRRCKGCSPS